MHVAGELGLFFRLLAAASFRLALDLDLAVVAVGRLALDLNAVADVLFGVYNPSGKLTMTFPVPDTDMPGPALSPVTPPAAVLTVSAEKPL